MQELIERILKMEQEEKGIKRILLDLKRELKQRLIDDGRTECLRIDYPLLRRMYGIAKKGK